MLAVKMHYDQGGKGMLISCVLNRFFMLRFRRRSKNPYSQPNGQDQR